MQMNTKAVIKPSALARQNNKKPPQGGFFMREAHKVASLYRLMPMISTPTNVINTLGWI